MVGVLSAKRESSHGVKSSKLCISQLLKQQEIDDLFGIPLKVSVEDATNSKVRYVARVCFNLPIGGVIRSLSMEFDKATMFLLGAEMSGEYQGLPFKQKSSHSYEFLGEAYYPLYVGKECKVVKTEIRTTTMLGKTQTNIKTVNYTYQVEGIEEIIVPAGTFRCFKVVQYDDAGNPISTQWESGRVRQYKVKSVDHETGEVIKLISLD